MSRPCEGFNLEDEVDLKVVNFENQVDLEEVNLEAHIETH